jgi:membrane protease YdiL (CAAX protease family)
MVNVFRKIFYVISWVVWLVVCYVLSSALIVELYALLPIDIPSDDRTILLTVLTVLTYIVTLTGFVAGPWLIRKHLKIPARLTEILGLGRKIAWTDLKKAVITYLTYLAVLIGAMLLVGLLYPELAEQEQELGFSKSGNSWWQLSLIFLALVVAAPIFEELMMRGVLFGRLRQKVSFWPATIVVSLLFAGAHSPAIVMVDTFILSLFLCKVREQTGAVYAPIIVHSIKNLLGFWLTFIVLV